MNHCLLQCQWVRPVWFGGLLQLDMAGGLIEPFTAWLEGRFQALAQRGEGVEEAAAYLSLSLWEIWKMRNEAVFRGIRPSPTFCLQKIQIALRESRSETPIPDQGITGTRPSVKRTYQWRRPPPGFLKCNSDAGLNMQQHKAMASYLLRDERGDLTCGYNKRLYTSKPLIAEALALREATLMAANMKMEKVLDGKKRQS